MNLESNCFKRLCYKFMKVLNVKKDIHTLIQHNYTQKQTFKITSQGLKQKHIEHNLVHIDTNI